MASTSSSSVPSLTTGTGPSQSDTSLWLHNKLGTSNDSWSGGTIVAQLNPEILSKIRNCFQDLQPQVKLKLLLSFFHIPKRNLDSWRAHLEEILHIASQDSELWVCMISEIMRSYPSTGILNTDIKTPDTNKKIFSDLVNDLKKAMKKCKLGDNFLPEECLYLNKNAFISVIGNPNPPEKHFKLKRKPKAAALKAELLAKSQEAANKLKTSSSGTFPIRKSTMPRKIGSDLTPLKGIPSRISASGFKSQRPLLQNRSLRKPESGGVKLLDINEQPIGFAAAKKRKKQQEVEEQAAKKAESNANMINNNTNKGAASNEVPYNNFDSHIIQGSESNKTGAPNYAAGLTNVNPPNPAVPTPAYAPPTPAYAPEQPSLSNNQQQQGQTTLTTSSSSIQTHQLIRSTSAMPPNSEILSNQQSVLAAVSRNVGSTVSSVTSIPSTTSFPAGLSSLEPIPQSEIRGSLQQQLPGYSSTQPRMTTLAQGVTRVVQLPTQPIPQRLASGVRAAQLPPPAVIGSVQQPARILQPGAIRSVLGSLTPNPPTSTQNSPAVGTSAIAQQGVPQQTARRSLTLTREQALEAQEMFRTANKVTRPEKALILGFMAGSRENPCPHLGNVVTIKLSENQENVLQQDQTYLTMIVETHFQMNYSTGEWRRIKKFRRIEDAN